jgi:ribosome-associated translation inhibitor RaiA/cold shock CspA family protein
VACPLAGQRSEEVIVMPDGVVQWFDPTTGEAAVVRAGRVFRADARAIESKARHPGARVHFDIERDRGAERAVRVSLRPGIRASHRHRRVGDLTGARHPDEKGVAPLAHTHPELNLSLTAHPLEIAGAWARCLQANDLETALALYASDATLHTADHDFSGRAHLQAYLEASPLLSVEREPVIRGGDGMVLLRWEGGHLGVEVRCRIAHGLIAEQWVGDALPEGGPASAATTGGPVSLVVVTRGDVADDARAYARRQIGAVIDHIDEPVLFARVKLTDAPDPARDRPALAQVTVDLNGEVVRAQVAGHVMREAVDLLQARLRDQLAHRDEHMQALRRRSSSPSGEWRHGDAPSSRPDYFDRPPDQRELVRRKSYVDAETTPDEAAFDMDQLDYDFYLFRDLASGEDALLERVDDGSYLLTRVRAAAVDAGPTAVALTVVDKPVPELDVTEAIGQISADGARHVLFVNAATGRGNVIYHRYDGHYGLIAPD